MLSLSLHSTQLAGIFDWLERGGGQLTFHGPMEDRRLCNKGNSVQVDPFPENDLVCHLVCLHFALHLNIEDLQTLASCIYTRETSSEFSTVAMAFKIHKVIDF